VVYLLLFVATTANGANDDSDEHKEKALRFVPLVTSTPLTGAGVGEATSYLPTVTLLPQILGVRIGLLVISFFMLVITSRAFTLCNSQYFL
jgi:hypothetical protein